MEIALKILPVLLVMLAAALNALMDVIKHHYGQSVFSTFKGKYFQELGWKNKYVDWDDGDRRRVKLLGVNVHPAFLDVWHGAKSLMIVCLCASIVDYTVIISPFTDFIILGVTWNATFSVFYNWIYVKRSCRKRLF